MDDPGKLLPRCATAPDMGSEHASSVVRCMPGEDATNGFFVSCFVRVSNSNKRKSIEETSTAQRKKRKRKKGLQAEMHAT